MSGAETIRHHAVPFHPGEHGSEESGRAEVKEAVELILEHAVRQPHESLGVIAMGIKHADRIEEALRRALRERDDLDDFFDENKPERFFIKNLERVQGDERDAIILTVGYGKTPDGRMQYRFGPLNQEGGERRLNVAVTRARTRMTVISSFSSADMDPDRCSARGTDLLRLYLQYAETAGDKLDRRAIQTPVLNPFEIDVRDALERAGIPLHCQLGCSGFRIDFAAKHPTQPGRMVLAIETDGATYHSSPTARDRDRLRQEHLENLGWRFHRIWSQDWFNHRQREIDRVVAAYKQAVQDADAGDANPTTQRQVTSVPPEHAAEPARGARPPVPRHRAIDEYSGQQLIDIVRWIESDTKLRTADALLGEVMRELGFERRGSKIVSRINAAIHRARR